jgi:hypothetical protein
MIVETVSRISEQTLVAQTKKIGRTMMSARTFNSDYKEKGLY